MNKVISKKRWLLTILILTLVAGALGTRTAYAAGVVGDGTPGSCTESAFDTALSGGGAVTFNCGANPVTITLTFYKQISANTTINGGNKITLKAPNTWHFQLYVNQTMTLKNLTLTGGNSSSAGSIENFGTLKINHVTFFKNKSTTHGGAISNYGTLIVKKSLFKQNRATNTGGAIHNDGGNVTIKSSTFAANKVTVQGGTGGAVANNSGNLILIGSTLSNNSANEGGGVWTALGTTNTISKSLLTGNKAINGGGIENNGDSNLSNSALVNNIAAAEGGGIYHTGSLAISMTGLAGNQASLGGGMRDKGDSTDIQQSTFNGNHAATDGGGLYTTSHPGVRNSTFSGNSAGLSSNGGGAVYAINADVSLEYVTIADNSAHHGAGVYADSSLDTTIYMQNVALSNNTGGNCDGSQLLSGGHNLSSDTNCGSVFTEQGDQNNTPANLGPLANNGGPTKTHLPQPGSPLIDKGYTDNHINIDQRDFTRPVGSSADIGAVEVQ